jgi:hypothetical protein
MNKSALQDIQQALNAIRSEIERVNDETKRAALELMLSTSNSVVALAKKMAKPETKTVTRTVAVPKTKVVTEPPQQQSMQHAGGWCRDAAGWCRAPPHPTPHPPKTKYFAPYGK